MPPDVTARVAVEQASTFGWERYVGENGAILGMTGFGASAPLAELQKKFGFTMGFLPRTRKATHPQTHSSLNNPSQQQQPPTPSPPSSGNPSGLDFISREVLDFGGSRELVGGGEVRGVTSNPAIFEKAIGEGVAVRAGPRANLRKERHGRDRVRTLRSASRSATSRTRATIMRTVYASTQARDGYVSLEVTMTTGERAADILDEARRLWKAVARPNVMIKVPGTPDGIVAFEELIADGINVNVTLLFAVDTYVKVANAYIAGLEKRARRAAHVRSASVASFFVSRIDSAIDKQLEGEDAQRRRTTRTRTLLKGTDGARSRSPTPRSPTPSTRSSSPARNGRPSPRRAR